MNGAIAPTGPARAASPATTGPERDALGRLDVASLELLDARALLERVDSKFLFPRAFVPDLLARLAGEFSVVMSADERAGSYETLYFDTPDHRFFHAHRRGRRPRHKVRIRHYAERDVCWLETKTRTRYGATHKLRLERAPRDFALTADDRAWIAGIIGETRPLAPSCVVRFPRVTLVGRDHEERLTLDLGVHFDRDGTVVSFDRAVVAEVKQPRLERRSPAMQAFAALGLRRRRMSKYCAAITLLGLEDRTHVFRPVVRDLQRTNDARPRS